MAVSQGYELCPGVKIDDSIWNLISGIKRGMKADLKFIKDLTIAAFGPEVLATSTNKGTAKGGRKKADGESPRQKKPPMDPNILKAIKGNLSHFKEAVVLLDSL